MKPASHKLYDVLFEFANQASSWRDVRHLQVLVWMVIGLIQEGTIHLSAWIDQVDSRAVFAQSTQRGKFLRRQIERIQSRILGVAPPQALSRLLLVMAVATLFLTLQGTALVDAQHRPWVDTHWQRGLSYLKLGRKWVKQCLSKGRKLFSLRSLTTARDPQPTFASIQQAEKLLFVRAFIVKSPHSLMH
jgi:hypothetical protein